MKQNMKSFTDTVLSLCFISSLLLAGSINVFAEAPGVIVIIGSDTTWTKADSTHTLTGPVFVSEGATLTIEAGATVDINGYYLLVNGTLRVIGSSTDKVHITNGDRLDLTPTSNGWNEQTGSGCLIENVIIDCNVTASVSVKIVGSVINGKVTVGGSSVISGCSMRDFTSEGSVVVSGSTINGDVRVGDSSEILDNTIDGAVYTENSVISNNDVGYDVKAGKNSVITYNNVGGCVSGGEILNNKITGRRVTDGVASDIVEGNVVSNNTIIGRVIAKDSAVVSNNVIQGGYTMIIKDVPAMPARVSITTYYGAVNVEGGSPLISNNVIHGAITTSSSGSSPIIVNNSILNAGIHIPVVVNVPAGALGGYAPNVGVGGSPEIGYNTVDGVIDVEAVSCKIFGNMATGIIVIGEPAQISDNTVKDGEGIVAHNGGTIERNYVSDTEIGIDVRSSVSTLAGNTVSGCDIGLKVNGAVTVRNNTITSSNQGILVTQGASATIERNFLADNIVGLDVYSQAVVKNNSIINSGTAVRLDNCPSATISYNNIENSNENSIYLKETSTNIDATNNWWGTTDTQTINLTIRDQKYDFGLGKVTFTPFLTEPNNQATSNPIPEFQVWIVLPMFLVATLAVSVYRRKMGKREAK